MLWRCPFKYLTGVPCPGCGTTRSVISLVHGDLHRALFYNPLGLLICLFCSLYFILWTIDYLCKTDFHNILIKNPWNKFLNKEKRRKYILIALAAIIAGLNTYWNYIKGI